MDANDPLARLAAQLERLSDAQLALGDAMAELLEDAPLADHRILGQAADASRSAARTAAEASAMALNALDT